MGASLGRQWDEMARRSVETSEIGLPDKPLPQPRDRGQELGRTSICRWLKEAIATSCRRVTMLRMLPTSPLRWLPRGRLRRPNRTVRDIKLRMRPLCASQPSRHRG